MSGNKNNDKKAEFAVDENTDSGFLSGPLDHWPGDEEQEQEQKSRSSQDDKECCDSGLVTSELDSDICDVLSECFSGVQLVDTSVPSSAQTEQFRCTVTGPESSIPAAHLALFYQPDDDGDTQLHIASIHGCVKSVGTLIKICPNKELLDISNDRGQTPLHLAVMSGNTTVTRMLVLAGLSIGVRDRTGETPLHKATAAGRVECLQALLAPVPEHPPRDLASVLNQKNYNGQACVHLAASAGHLEALKTLVYFRADINLKENLSGRTALHIACARGDTRMASYLLERSALLPRATDYGGRTPRRLARHTPAARLFASDDDSEDDDDSDDEMCRQLHMMDNESLFERLRDAMNSSSSSIVA